MAQTAFLAVDAKFVGFLLWRVLVSGGQQAVAWPWAAATEFIKWPTFSHCMFSVELRQWSDPLATRCPHSEGPRQHESDNELGLPRRTGDVRAGVCACL